jgi:hypothetical protein
MIDEKKHNPICQFWKWYTFANAMAIFEVIAMKNPTTTDSIKAAQSTGWKR